MRALLLSLALAVPARAATPEDAALMDQFRLKEVYQAIEALKPRIDALAKEIAAIRDSHSGKAEPAPGGARRKEARAELRELRSELRKLRLDFKDNGVDQRLQQVLVMAMQFKEGENEKANRSFQSGIRHAQLIGEYKDYDHTLDVLLDEEEAAFNEAVGRWQLLEEARLRRRRLFQGTAAAAAIVPPAIFLWRRRRRNALLLTTDGDHLGRWRLGKSTKSWTYGTRWDNADGGAGSSASVRLFDPRLCEPPSSAAKLLAALRAAAPPKHPGLAAPVESFPAGASAVLVYPPSPAKPLSVWLQEGRGVRPAQAAVFLKRLAPALDAAHKAGKAHGGLDPDCVLVGGDGTVVLEDFGVAAALAASGLPPAGSPAYAAPELETGPPSPAADLYSLGVLLYELVTGRHPFEGTNLPAMKREKRYLPLSRTAPGCPPVLDALMDGLLEPDPARRRPAPGGLEAAVKAL